MSDSEKTQKTRFVDGLDMKGEESKGFVRCLAWTTAKTNCHWLLWGDCGRIELGEKIRSSGREVLYLKCLLGIQWRYTDRWIQGCGIHTRDIYLGQNMDDLQHHEAGHQSFE